MNFIENFRRGSDYESIDSQGSPDFSRIACIICTFVLLREFHPIDSFLTPYLTSPPLNFTLDQLNKQIYPFGFLSSFVSVIVVFLITDYLRYKSVIILHGISGILTYGLLLGKPTLPVLYVEQLCYGFFFASTVASGIYLYAKVDDTNKYQKISALVQTCLLLGQFIRGIFSQLVMSFSGLGEISLVYFSTGGLVLATIWSIFIPSVGHSIYFHRVEKLKSDDSNQEVTIIKLQNSSTIIQRIACDFKMAYTNPYVLKWTIWCGMTCGVYNLILTYSQVLWQTVVEESDGSVQLMNGAVDSISTLTGALAAYSVGHVKLNWKSNADLFLTSVSFILAFLAQFMYWNSSLMVLYLVYILFCCIFQIVLTIAHSEVAQNIEKDSYGLIFGFNVAVAFGIGYVITALFIQGWIVLFSLRQQFLFYTLYFVAVAFLYLIQLCWRCGKHLTQ